METNYAKFFNQKNIKILNWIFSILIGIISIQSLMSFQFVKGIILLLVALLLIPLLKDFWRNKFPFLNNKVINNLIIIFLFFIGIQIGNDNNESAHNKKHEKKTLINSEHNKSNKTEKIHSIKYEIINEIIKRYDNSPHYIVLIDEVDLSNNKFKLEIENLINKIVTEKGAKISIDIFDNKNALNVFNKSHYVENTLGRILNKDELVQLEKHYISSFDGELETEIYPNTLNFFPSATKKNAKLGKYIETIEYNPIINDYRIVKKQRAQLDYQKTMLEKKKKEFENKCFNSLDGSHRELVKYVKSNMNDKKSFSHEETTYITLDEYVVVNMKFRGKNAYGNIVLDKIKAKISYNCEVLEIID
ncbi:MAG: hypothetical protein HYU67_01270 [Flavobacteriia bacterium]|nr:hypothetical protein [Flavobacteriia bacterium]